MKNLIVKSILVIFAIFSLTSCALDNQFDGSDDLIILSRDLPSFNKISAGSDMIVNVTQGPVQDVQITVNSNLQDKLLTTVNNETLNITLKNGNYRNTTFIVNIQIPELNKLKFQDHVFGEVFYDGESLELDINDASELELYGQANTLQVSLEDAGKIKGYSFISETLNASLSDAAILEITCNGQLNGSAKDASKVRYKGNPILNFSTKDAATISNRN
jgi:hypothetical protein